MNFMRRSHPETQSDSHVALLKYYSAKNVFKSTQFAVVRGKFRTACEQKVLARLLKATAFADPCCICGCNEGELQCPFECASRCVRQECVLWLQTCPICRSGFVFLFNVIEAYFTRKTCFYTRTPFLHFPRK